MHFNFNSDYFTHKNRDGLTLFIHDCFDIEVFQSSHNLQKLSSILDNFAKLEYLVFLSNLNNMDLLQDVQGSLHSYFKNTGRLYFHVISTYIILWSLMDWKTSTV